jgi:signal transduction histidine kinase
MISRSRIPSAVRGMQERVHHLGGWLDVSGAPGRGTTIMLSIPRLALNQAEPHT